ncbi:hypothetical protein [Microbacterium timonense]|jgi:hypothetical protein|uniref:hypothetical protein n=1 Tax=Microbacterium timonense TaxID=2086576 RepID=UPI000D0E44DC|nr:hypothetical protein [Microbacterium timonense]
MTRERGRMPHSAAVEDLLVERMRRDLTKPKWWRTVWGRVTIAAGAVVVAGTAVAAVVLLEARPVSDTAIVQCMESASRNLDGTLSGSAVSIAAPDGVLPIDDAVGICEQMWASGAFENTDPLDPSPTPGTVPSEFTTCVTDEGTAAVVPGRIECSALQLHPYDPEAPVAP